MGGAFRRLRLLLMATLLMGAVLVASSCRYVDDSRAKPLVVAEKPAASTAARKLPPVTGTPKAGGRVVVAIGGEPPTLNPVVIQSDWVGTTIMTDHVYETLARQDPYDHPRYRYKPGLATSWEVSDDRKTYTFHLRKGVRFHDGRPFSADDVIATFDKVMNPKAPTGSTRSYLKDLASWKKVDEHTVRFTMKKVYFKSFSSLQIPIFPAHVIAKLSPKDFGEADKNPLTRHPVGTGPFRFVTWETNVKIELARNDAFWGKKPHLERVVFRIVTDENVALILAERGELDVLGTKAELWTRRIPGSKVDQLFWQSEFYDSNYAWIGWNQQRPFFQDKRVRQAMTHLVNRPAIIQGLQHGLARPTACHFYWAGPSCDPELEPLPYDPEQAVKLLEQADWVDHDGDGVRDKDGVPFRFNFMVPSSSDSAVKMVTAIKEDMRRAGIDLFVQRTEWSGFVNRLQEHRFDACTLAWVGGVRQDPNQIWHSSSRKGGSNFIDFNEPKADAMIEQAQKTLDDEKRAAIYREFGRFLHEEQPYTTLYVRPRLSLVSKRLGGVRETLSWWQFEDWWLKEPAK